MKYPIFLLSAFFLSACNMVNTEQFKDVIVQEQTSAVAAEYANAFENASSLQLFFKEDQTKAIYLEESEGDASFTEETFWLSDRYVKTIIEKENEISYTVYRITSDAIELLYTGQTDSKASIAELDQMPAQHISLAFPIEKGTAMEDWVITNDDQQLVTPFATFYHVIELTKESPEQVIKRYVALGFGLVKETIQNKTDKGIEETTFLLDTVKY